MPSRAVDRLGGRGRRRAMGEVPGIVVDADGHVCEPADLWERGLPARFRERALRLRWTYGVGA